MTGGSEQDLNNINIEEIWQRKQINRGRYKNSPPITVSNSSTCQSPTFNVKSSEDAHIFDNNGVPLSSLGINLSPIHNEDCAVFANDQVEFHWQILQRSISKITAQGYRVESMVHSKWKEPCFYKLAKEDGQTRPSMEHLVMAAQWFSDDRI